jgi:hypothetical protein
MRTLVLLFALAPVLACATSRSDAMESWVGTNEAELLSSWGAPDKSVELHDGSRVHTWVTEWTYYIGGRSRQATCRESFTVGAESLVERWSYNGC